MSNSLLDRMNSGDSTKNSSGNPKFRRRGKKPGSKKDTPLNEKSYDSRVANENEPGPSESRSKKEERQKRTVVDENEPVATGSQKVGFSTGEDFIAFELESRNASPTEASDARNYHGLPARPEPTSERAAGKKRRWEEIDNNDGYASKKQKVDAASRRCPWAADVDWEGCRNVAEMLNKEVEAFTAFVSPTQAEHDVRSMIVQLISNCIEKAFPDAKVTPFGSYGTKLYLPSGDIDLVVQSKSMATMNKEGLLRSLANVVRRSGITDKVTVIAKAKVPIIKFNTTHGRISVDISVNQLNGIAAGKMINRFLEDFPALRAIVLVIKSFLNQRNMNEVFSGGLGSYSIVCLAVSFLQMHPKLRRGEIDPSQNLGVLVMEFFEFYGRYFNYQEAGISLRHGGTYFSKARRGWSDFRKPSLLAIEDPNDISNDISKGSFAINQVRQTFAGAFEILKTAAYVRASIISARQQQRVVSLRSGSVQSRLVPEEMSILSGVMGITQETINHRRLVQEVYDDGILHRLLGIEIPGPDLVVTEVVGQVVSSDRNAASQSVLSSWTSANHDANSDDEKAKPRAADDSYESESRYDIKVGSPSRKRRRVGTDHDEHIVYTADEEEGEHSDASSADSLAEEEAWYDAAHSLANEKDGMNGAPKAHNLTAEGRRAYWISKGVGVDHDSDDA
ncbi:hypothetical protein SCHPADRAFT_899095 [Schizopora paradoxa]|uniref:polynucleotide adenylyltransferase n=1 Tax=Schizopora paradoxa TaxID=27342 RepID=A0A0H2SQA0_9AGAM|nr:hypothetical protein SCHPADRAFT_899095 [Schizopora paradoxa]